MSKMSSKEDDCVFTWKLFTGWDFMIGHAETALNKVRYRRGDSVYRGGIVIEVKELTL